MDGNDRARRCDELGCKTHARVCPHVGCVNYSRWCDKHTSPDNDFCGACKELWFRCSACEKMRPRSLRGRGALDVCRKCNSSGAKM